MRKLSLTAFLLSLASICLAQNDAASFAAELFRYTVDANIVYHTANNYQNKLDVYRPAEASQPTPVVVVIHGGGWVEAGTLGRDAAAVAGAIPARGILLQRTTDRQFRLLLVLLL